MERANITESVVHAARLATGAAIAGFTRVLDRVQGVTSYVAIMEDPGANLHLSEADKVALNDARVSAERFIAADPESYRQDLRRRLHAFDPE
jgi:hypothetical protein